MAPDHDRDDEDTREHPAAPRYPDAAPPAEQAGDEAPSAYVPPPDQGATGQSWQQSQQPGQQWPPADQQQWPAGGSQQPGQAWQQPAEPTQQPTGGWQQPQQPPAQPWQQPPNQVWQQPQQPPSQWGAAPAWGPEAQYDAGYPTSPMVAIAAIVLLVFGLLVTLIGGLGAALGGVIENALRELAETETTGLEGFDLSGLSDVFLVIFGILLVIGILHLVSAIGIFLHKQWARVIGILLAVLGTLIGVLGLVGASNVAASMDGSEWIVPIAMAVGYGFVLFALIAGSSHFRRRRAS